ncbi:MAG: protein BatD [Saprospiraceae bacterium]|jgi:hypothetical protein|nr:protein BatD [Saprospiraceae bacterium]
MKNGRLILFSLHLYLLSGIGLILSAQDSRFFMETDRTEIAEGETFILNIVLENMNGKNLQLPDLAPFRVVQGPSTSSSVTIINGKRSGTQSYQYLLLAAKKGKFTIGSATIQSDGKTIKSNTLSIDVTGQSKSKSNLPGDNSSETFVRLELKDNNAYVGQQTILNLVLYTRTNIESFQLLNEPLFDGFFSQAINDIRDQPHTVNIKGKEYYSQVVRRWALFPQKTGLYNLGPVNCNLDIAVENGQSSFFFRDTRQETVLSNTLKCKVQSLPSPAPGSFTGAVGNFTMNAQIKKSTVVTGEGVTISLQIEGDGDSRIVQAPAFELPYGFEQYSPSLIKDETYQRGDKIMMKKEFDYILVPSVDSTYTITPLFSYFDLNSASYKTIQSSPFTINVIKGDLKSRTKSESSQTILGTKPSDDDHLMPMDRLFFGSKWYFFILSGILLSFLLAAYYKYFFKQKKLYKKDDLMSISDFAKESLSTAASHISRNQPELFYHEISKATTVYLQKKFNLPDITHNPESIFKHLSDREVPEHLIAGYKSIQSECELAKYAGMYSSNMTATLGKAEEWIEAMEKLNS